MARQVGPDQAERVFFVTSGTKKGTIVPAGTPVPLYADNQCTLPADVLALDGSTIAGTIPTVLVGDTLEAPLFQFPDVADPVVYTRVLGGPVVALHPRTDDRVDSLRQRLVDLEAGGSGDALVVHKAGTETISGAKTFSAAPTVPTPSSSGHAATKAYVDGAVDDLSGVTNASGARTQLGLGDSATRNVGTTSGTVVDGAVAQKFDVTGPTGGVTDATSAFTAAATAAVAEGRDYIRVAPGLYHCPGMTPSTISNCYVIGDGVTFTSTTYVYPFTLSEWVQRGTRSETGGDGNGAICFEVDDALIQQWTGLFPLTKRLGIKIGVGWITNNGAEATWLPEVARHGWEIISHTIDHGQVTALSESQIEAMAESTLVSIEAITGSRENVGFIYPQHVRSAETDRVLSKHFARGRGVGADRLYPPTGAREWLVSSHLLDTDFSGGTLPENVKDLLRNVARTNGRQGFYFHFDAPKSVTHPPALTAMVAFARSLGIQIVLPRELWSWNNVVRDSYDEQGTKWTIGSNFSRSTDFAYKGTDSFKFTAGAGFTTGSVTSQLLPMVTRPGMFAVYRASFRRKNTVAVTISANWGLAFNTAQTVRNVDGSMTSLATVQATPMFPSSGTTIAIADWERTAQAIYVAPCVDAMNLVLSVTNIAGSSAPLYFDEVKLELVDYVVSATFQATLTGTTGVKVVTGVPNLSRHPIVLQPRSAVAGRLSYTVSQNSITVVSTDAADTAVVDIIVHPGPSYNGLTFPTTGA